MMRDPKACQRQNDEARADRPLRPRPLPDPVRAQVGIVNGLTQEKVCIPGETFESYIRLKNNGAKEKSDQGLSDRLFVPGRRGSFYDALRGSSCGPMRPGSPSVPKQVTIPGLATTDVKYACRDSRRIQRWSGPAGASSCSRSFRLRLGGQGRGGPGKKIAFGVSQVMRYGVQIVTHFGDTGKRSLKFLKTEISRTRAERPFRSMSRTTARDGCGRSPMSRFTPKRARWREGRGGADAGYSPDVRAGSSWTSVTVPPAPITPSSSSTTRMSRSSGPRSS